MPHRSRIPFVFAVILLSCFASRGFSQDKSDATPPPEAKPRIRTITAFVNLDRNQYEEQFKEAVTMLHRAETTFESRGYKVQTLRVATQPFGDYIKGISDAEAMALFLKIDSIADKNKLMVAIGPAMPNPGDSPAQADLLANILRGTKHIFASLTVAGQDGVRWPAVSAAARVIKKLENTEHSEGNFHFAAAAMVPAMSPFFPAAYNEGFGHAFAIGLESPGVVEAAFKGSADFAAARQRLTEMLGAVAFDVQTHANRIDMESGWRFAGIDLSPAPGVDRSIGTAIEALTQQPFGSAGTMTAAATITAGVKDVAVHQVGYNGLMLPIAEDPGLARRWNEGGVSIDALLLYSAVCATGLDTVPLPGDITEQQLSRIVGDMASLAFKWSKPLTARLMPVTDKQEGDMTEFTDPALVNLKVLALK